MSNKIEELKRKNWLKRNSILQNESYVTKILEHYGINKYQLECNGFGDYDVGLEFGGKNYKIQIDEEIKGFHLLQKNCALNPSQKKHKYHLIDDFYGEDVLVEIVKYIKSKNIKDVKNINNN